MKTSPFGGDSKRGGSAKLAVSRDRAHTPAGYPDWRGRPRLPRVPLQMARYAALLLVLAAFAGCGDSTVKQEPSITVTGGDGRRAEGAPGAPAGEDAPRIAVVTHGQASSPFWAIVRTGVEAAERQMNVQVDYEAPDVYSLRAHDRRSIDDAVASKPDGLVVSFPEPGLSPAIRRAVQGRDPRDHDQLGQRRRSTRSACSPTSASPRSRAGLAAGRRLARRACVARCA